jgi:hypothetical protein
MKDLCFTKEIQLVEYMEIVLQQFLQPVCLPAINSFP